MEFRSREIDGNRVILLREMTNITPFIGSQKVGFIKNSDYHSILLCENYEVDVYRSIKIGGSRYIPWILL